MSDPGRLSRRDFLKLRRRSAPIDARSSIVSWMIQPAQETPRARSHSLPIMRPPGAVAEPQFLDRCTRCGDCLTACPHDAIVNAPERSRRAEDTPMIDPSIAPCYMCDETPCIPACETGALLPTAPLKMADAQVKRPDCLAHMGQACSVCVGHCPVPGAISLVDAKPVIDADRCTGCGVCHFVCPAPNKAIMILPLRDRPKAPPFRPTHDG